MEGVTRQRGSDATRAVSKAELESYLKKIGVPVADADEIVQCMKSMGMAGAATASSGAPTEELFLATLFDDDGQ